MTAAREDAEAEAQWERFETALRAILAVRRQDLYESPRLPHERTARRKGDGSEGRDDA